MCCHNHSKRLPTSKAQGRAQESGTQLQSRSLEMPLANSAMDRSELHKPRAMSKREIAYMAPELLEHSEIELGSQGAANSTRVVYRATDVFSFGCVLYEILTAKKLYDREECKHDDEHKGDVEQLQTAKDVQRYVLQGKRERIPKGVISEACAALIRQCWAQHPVQRPCLDDIVSELQSTGIKTLSDS